MSDEDARAESPVKGLVELTQEAAQKHAVGNGSLSGIMVALAGAVVQLADAVKALQDGVETATFHAGEAQGIASRLAERVEALERRLERADPSDPEPEELEHRLAEHARIYGGQPLYAGTRRVHATDSPTGEAS